MTKEYAKEIVLNSINSKLDEEKEDCKKEGREYSKENIKYEVFRSELHHDNFLDIAGSLSMTDTEKNHPIVGIREEAKLKHKEIILTELWEKAE